MNESLHKFNPELERTVAIDRLTATDTPLAERIEAARVVFPGERKAQMRLRAEKDSMGRPALCFRVLGYDELRLILVNGKITALDQPSLQEKFNVENVRYALQKEIENMGREQFGIIEADYNWLLENFSLEAYMSFVIHRLPRSIAFKLHASDGLSGNAQGLLSLSIGAPILPPLDPSPSTGEPAGTPVVEMVIPSRDLIVHPLDTDTPFREMEKEVNVLSICAEWITDIYQGLEDFNTRFIQDDQTTVANYSERPNEYESRSGYASRNAYETLWRWKDSESIADLVPISKTSELDPTSPTLARPLVDK